MKRQVLIIALSLSLVLLIALFAAVTADTTHPPDDCPVYAICLQVGQGAYVSCAGQRLSYEPIDRHSGILFCEGEPLDDTVYLPVWER